ncbi:hypothetical protein D3C84_679180 [compost metagenome]
MLQRLQTFVAYGELMAGFVQQMDKRKLRLLQIDEIFQQRNKLLILFVHDKLIDRILGRITQLVPIRLKTERNETGQMNLRIVLQIRFQLVRYLLLSSPAVGLAESVTFRRVGLYRTEHFRAEPDD